MLSKILFFLDKVKKNLNSIQRDFIVSKILFELLWIIKKKVLRLDSSNALSNALDEFIAKLGDGVDYDMQKESYTYTFITFIYTIALLAYLIGNWGSVPI